jgi:hypothetical protein
MRKITMVLFVLLVAVSAQAQNFSWTITFQKGRDYETVSVSRMIRMENGDPFVIDITPSANCYCYIVSYDSERNITVIHDQPIRGKSALTIGPFEVGGSPGTDTLYVIMSTGRQMQLERLIQSYASNEGSRQHANSLYREIVRLQNAASELGEPASSFIQSGGTTRGSTTNYVNSFSEKDLYVRAIAIRH